jgi:hypothetical protein
MPSYSDAEVIGRNKSGGDKKRAQKTDALFNQATQPPHDDDMAALSKLKALSGDDSTGGYATNDARNYARMKLNTLPGMPQQEYSEAKDGGGFLGSVGGVLKTLSPLAGMIPGIGMPIGALAGAAGSALGGAMSGDKFNLGKTLLSGATSGLAGLANPLGGPKIPDAPEISAMGSQKWTPDGKPYVPPVTPAPSAPGGGIMSKLGNVDLGQLANIGGKTAEVLGARSQRAAQERFNNANLQMRTRQLGMAEDEYASRAPLRTQALAKLTQRKPGGSIFGGSY